MNWDSAYEDEFDEPDDEEVTVACLSCGAEMFVDAEMCPKCFHFQLDDAPEGRRKSVSSSLRGRPMWYTVLALAGTWAVIYALLFLF